MKTVRMGISSFLVCLKAIIELISMDLEISMSLILLFLRKETLNKSRFFLQKFKKYSIYRM